MPESNKDHTKSILPYQGILQAHEQEYRATSPAKRDVVIDSIVEQINDAASTAGARVADGDSLRKVLTTATSNNTPINLIGQ